jgi:CheY-like chemotaxis protein
MSKVLIIDDHPEIRENISEILELAGYETLIAVNGKEGVDKAIHDLPDLIICDIMMPELDGYGVLHLLRKNQSTQHTPFIFLTAKAERSDYRKGMEMGADDFITKPFDDVELLTAVETRFKKLALLQSKYSADTSGVSAFLRDLKDHGVPGFSEENYSTTVIFKQQPVYQEGNRPHYLYLVKSGKIKTVLIHPDGKEYITNFYNAGDYFGYLPLLEDRVYDDNATALENTELVLIPKEEFLNRVLSDSQVMLAFIRLLSQAVSEKEERMLQLAYGSLRKRVAAALADIYKKNMKENNHNNIITITREELAQYIGTAKESAIRVVSDFKEEKLINITDGKISIPDVTKLEKLAY